MKSAPDLHLCLKGGVAALIMARGSATAYAYVPTDFNTEADMNFAERDVHRIANGDYSVIVVGVSLRQTVLQTGPRL